MPRDTLSLASIRNWRASQNQLHIHIDCIRADVRDALQRCAVEDRPALGAADRYHLPVIITAPCGSTDDALGHNPFKLLAQGVPGAAADMGRHTLVVVGMWFDDGAPASSSSTIMSIIASR